MECFGATAKRATSFKINLWSLLLSAVAENRIMSFAEVLPHAS
jgi:hypothetical protein